MTLTPDPFSLSPLLSVLPSLGNVTRLEDLISSLFARFESVEALREYAETSDSRTRLANEAAMLRQILDWLAVQPEEGGNIDE
ncbi:MAG: hypothetical protein ACK5GN_12775 [Pseudomonadota bacterium]|jgi:hypothetical protein